MIIRTSIAARMIPAFAAIERDDLLLMVGSDEVVVEGVLVDDEVDVEFCELVMATVESGDTALEGMVVNMVESVDGVDVVAILEDCGCVIFRDVLT